MNWHSTGHTGHARAKYINQLYISYIYVVLQVTCGGQLLINILRVGTDCAELNACGDFASTTEQLVANGIVEAGTITTKPSTSLVVGSSAL
jgi:hypothetical protein